MYQRLPTNDGPVWLNETTWSCRCHIPSARFPAAVQKCLYGCKVEQPPRPGPASKQEAKTEEGPRWASFGDYSIAELRGEYITDLRKYARHSLGIIRASKIPGGKAVLLKRIQQARRA